MDWGTGAQGGLLGEILASLSVLPAAEQQQVRERVRAANAGKKWCPNPGPQTDAYFSEADVLLYGGEPGGGKSQLCLGLAFNEHKRSMVMRRNYGDLERIIEDALAIHGSKKGFNGSPPPRLRISKDQTIQFRAAQRIGDEQGTMGQGRDLLAVDEATHFAEQQIRFMMGWVRSEIPGQRCRTVLATNPPLRPEGMWVNKMFAPWLDPKFPFPAKPGELRWVISDEDGKDFWVNGPEDAREVTMKDGQVKLVRPTSRTYIPAAVKDNPYYAATDYERQLDAMGEPHRSLLMGGFRTAFADDEFQMIPTAWVQAAQERWTSDPPPDVPMCAMGVDASGGGTDPMTISRRYDGWFDEIIEVPAKSIPQDRAGTFCAGQVLSFRRDSACAVIDMGGGYGGSIYEFLKNVPIDAKAYKGAAKSVARTSDRTKKFYNKRSEAIWKFREALDPDQPGGSHIMLPPDQVLLADLTAPTYEDVPLQGTIAIKAEPKEDVVERLGRSTDRGDCVIMAWVDGVKTANVRGGFRGSAASVTVVTRPGQSRSSGGGYRGGGGEHG